MSQLNARTCATTVEDGAWPIQRILFLMAGTITLLGTVLAAVVSRWFLLLPALAAANQLLMVATGWCPMSLLLIRARERPARAATSMLSSRPG